jgi:hypothetical protein
VRKRGRKLQVEGELRIVESTGTWGVYEGERITIGNNHSFRDDLGVRIREMFEPGARAKIDAGEPTGEAFTLPRVRVTVEVLEPKRRS